MVPHNNVVRQTAWYKTVNGVFKYLIQTVLHYMHKYRDIIFFSDNSL